MTDVTAIDNSDDKNNSEAVLDDTIADLEAEEAVDGSRSVSPGATLITRQLADQIKIKARKDKGTGVPVRIEQTKRVKLNQLLELLREFTPKEIKGIVKVDRRRRRVEKLQNKNQGDLSGILGK